MADLVASGRMIDLILALVAVEWLVLAAVWRRTGRGIAPLALLANLAAGATLLMAARSALVGADWTVTAAWLAAAGLAHLADLAKRWR
jgi:hypothetical protein